MIWMMAAAAGTALALTALMIMLRRRFLMVTVLGDSMLPAYRSGDRVLARRQEISSVRTGQVVVIDLSQVTGRPRARSARWIIKRVVAMPGDPVPQAMRDALSASQDTVVPPGHLLVIGDNRHCSADSRYLGYIPARALLGVVVN